MINRNYLPYKSAREYADRGMAKWMGFFISEHTTAINTQGDTIDFSNNMDEDEKRLLLNQLYFFKGLSYLYTSIQREPYLGRLLIVLTILFIFQLNKIYCKFQSAIF